MAENPGPARDATSTAVLQGAASLGWQPVELPSVGNQAIVARIDAALAELWADKNAAPTEPASDQELLRRVYLDLAGRTPTVQEARAYLQDADSNRYVKLVDDLLTSRDHATHLAVVWRKFLLPEGVDLSRFGGTEAFDEWLSGQFARGVAYDEIVRRLLLAEGRLSRSGPLLFYAAAKLDPDLLAARSARVFLGLRLECAQCHDDPFEPWTQSEFWGYAAFFARISRPQAALEEVSTVLRVHDVDRGEVMLPDTEEVVLPTFLDGMEFEEGPQAANRRTQLATWLTRPENPFFARAAVNRVWAHLFGRGIVDPVDGFGVQNEPCSPGLLDLMAGYFVQSGFDLRGLIRATVLSRAYRLSSGARVPDPARRTSFAQMNVKTLTAEQVYDCITVATMFTPDAGPDNGFNIMRTGNAGREAFLQQFRTPAGRSTEYLAGIPQALTLMNGNLIDGATGISSSGLLASLEAPFFSNDQRIETLYLATLSRQPRGDEWPLLRLHVNQGDGDARQEALADILWALLNSAEFTMNH